MPNTDKDIISVLLKSVWDKGLISEMTYRSSLSRLRTFDDSPSSLYSKLQHNDKERPVNGYTKNQG